LPVACLLAGWGLAAGPAIGGAATKRQSQQRIARLPRAQGHTEYWVSLDRSRIDAALLRCVFDDNLMIDGVAQAAVTAIAKRVPESS
jgi:hypothetical protein